MAGAKVAAESIECARGSPPSGSGEMALLLSGYVGISIRPRQQRERPRMHINAIQSKTRPRADRHAPDVRAGVLPARHQRFDQIARSKAEPALLARDMADGEAVLVRPAHLPCPVPLTGDQQH